MSFVATLGGIAFYVQRQAVPDAHDAVRTAVTQTTQPAGEETPIAALPWQDRLDLAALKPVPIGPAAAPAAKAAGKSSDPDFAGLAQNLGDSRLVQELTDGHRILYTLDPVLQDAALQIFRNREVPYAAAVILDVRDNTVLALAGHSSMDPQVDPLEITTTAWAPAASTFKLVTAAALRKQNRALAKTRVCFSGGLHGITDEPLSCGVACVTTSLSMNKETFRSRTRTLNKGAANPSALRIASAALSRYRLVSHPCKAVNLTSASAPLIV